MSRWTTFPLSTFTYDTASLEQHWTLLHTGDCEPFPASPALQAGWVHFHNGQFQEAHAIGMHHAEAGSSLSAKAAGIYAIYLEPGERKRMEILEGVVRTCASSLKLHPERASTHYWHAIALHHISQGLSVAKVLAQGVGGKIRESLEAAVRLQPDHADAHVALGLFHAEIIDKVGPLIGSMTYGARKDAALGSLRRGLQLTPDAPAVLMDYAHALLLLEGDSQEQEATQLYEKAAQVSPRDAAELLQVRLAQSQLTD